MAIKKKAGAETLVEALKLLLKHRKASTQEDLCEALVKQGYEINQSKISRLLRKVGSIKVTNEQGQTVYSIPREPAPPAISTPIQDLVVDIVSNESLVVIFTSPGSASMVARILDYNQTKTQILGCIAGDDTIFVAPKSTKNIQKLCQEIKLLLGGF
ncbi:MAG: arginine repressor [Verrucomicrobia bacterium]|nr:arginine repressor [Verrucomicrobiota bacterium]